MKTRPALAWLAASLILSPILAVHAQVAADTPPPTIAPAPAPPPPPPPAAVQAAPDTEKKTDLELRMDRVSKAFRKLRKQVADPTQNVASLALLATMEDALKEAVELTPEKADDVPADQRAKFISDYKAGIHGMLDELAKVGDALTAGKNDDAAKMVADVMALEKKDHTDFRRPEDH
jgi:soluble cytochrome b562